MEETNVPTVEVPLQSQSIGKLAAALAKAQGKIEEAKRDSENPFFKSSYADLSAVWKACRAQLSSNGLAVIQAVDQNGWLRTTLAHESGEWVASVYPVKPIKDDPQGLGSAITYARRYSLAAIVGIAPEGDDDDAEGAQARDKQEKKAKGDPALSAEIVAAAKELALKQGGDYVEIIKSASGFEKDGKKVPGFSDPFKVDSTKWLNMTLHKLRDLLAVAELGGEKTVF